MAEPTVAKQGEDKILVEVPGIKTQADEQRIRELIARAAHLQLMAVDEDRAARVSTMNENEARSFGDVILPDVATSERYLLKQIPVLDGSMLTDAKVGFDQNNQPVINFSLNGQGAKIFGDFTAKSVGKRMAVVLDDKVYSAPNIRERIGGGHVQISGSFKIEEAADLAIALRSGALLAPVYIMEKRSVGPSLGADSIRFKFFGIGTWFCVGCYLYGSLLWNGGSGCRCSTYRKPFPYLSNHVTLWGNIDTAWYGWYCPYGRYGRRCQRHHYRTYT